MSFTASSPGSFTTSATSSTTTPSIRSSGTISACSSSSRSTETGLDGLRPCRSSSSSATPGSPRETTPSGSADASARRAPRSTSTSPRIRAGWWSAFDDADRDELCDAPGKAGTLDDPDYALDVLVGQRRLFGQAFVRRRANDDAERLELAPQLRPRDLLLGARPREPPARAVAGAAEGELDRARLSGEDEARRAHAAGDEDGLADLAIGLRDLVRAGRERPRRALPMHEQLALVVPLDLGDVVRVVVDLSCSLGGLVPQHAADCRAYRVGDRLAVGPGGGGRGRHRRQVGASFGRGGRGARELAVGQVDAVPAHRAVHLLDVVAAHLMPEPARARVDQHRHLIVAKPVDLGRGRVENALNALKLDEVVARAHRPELAGTPVARSVRNRGRVGAGEAAAGLGAVEILRAAERPRPLPEHGVDLRTPAGTAFRLAGAGRNGTGDLVHERLPPAAEVGLGQRQGEQAHPPVDVGADAPPRDDTLGEVGGGDAADREAVTLMYVRHCERRLDDPRQGGHVLDLLERAVALDRREQLAIGEHPGRDAHVGTGRRREFPEHLGDLNQLRHRAPRVRASRPYRPAETRAGGAWQP